jgi:serpin B
VQEQVNLQEELSEKNVQDTLESTSDMETDIAEPDLPANDYGNKVEISKDFLLNFYDFTEQTFAQIIRENEEKNQIYAPLNLYLSLSMLYELSEGEAKEEIQKALHMSDAKHDSSELIAVISSLQERRLQPIGKLNINTSLWLNDEINYQDDLLNLLQSQYKTEIFKVDLKDNESQNLMAKWLYENANFEIQPDHHMSLDNSLNLTNPLAFTSFSTLDFYDEWLLEFNEEDTRADTFFLSDTEKITCDYMNLEEKDHLFMVGEDYISTECILKGGVEYMLFILPKEGMSVDDFIEDKGKLADVIDKWNNEQVSFGKVKLSIPKFAYENEIDLIKTTESLGINKIFDINSKAFSSFADEDIYISGIRQASKIEVNEKGCAASSFTQIVAQGSAGSKDEAEIILNRPFIYVLMKDKVPFLTGVVRNPLG